MLVLAATLATGGFLPSSAPFADPLGLRSWRPAGAAARPPSAGGAPWAAGALLPLLGATPAATAVSLQDAGYLENSLDPKLFQPVCPASDGFYRAAQTIVVGTVGAENYKEYAPLIAGGLLRVRLELCVVESFFYEAIIPFIKENGLSWVLPLHETVETFLAGTIFAVASNFILIGSTKLLTVHASPTRLFCTSPHLTSPAPTPSHLPAPSHRAPPPPHLLLTRSSSPTLTSWWASL